MAWTWCSHHRYSQWSQRQCEVSLHFREVLWPSLQQWPGMCVCVSLLCVLCCGVCVVLYVCIVICVVCCAVCLSCDLWCVLYCMCVWRYGVCVLHRVCALYVLHCFFFCTAHSSRLCTVDPQATMQLGLIMFKRCKHFHLQPLNGCWVNSYQTTDFLLIASNLSSSWCSHADLLWVFFVCFVCL